MRFQSALLAILVAAPALAATRTWTGTTDGNWVTPTNWSDAAPVAGDDLVFPASGLNQNNTNNFPAGTSFNSITVSGGAYTLNGNAITLGVGGITTITPIGCCVPLIALPITLVANQTWNLGRANIGATNLNGFALTIAPGSDTIWSGPISGAGSITLNGSVVNGPVRLNLTGVNTTIAPLTVNSSFVIVMGTYLGPITANANGLGSLGLATGATAGPITINEGGFDSGIGPSFGTALTGSLSLNGGFTFFEELIAGVSDFNKTSVTGSVTINNAFLHLENSSTVPPGTTFTIIDNDGSDPVVGTFAALPEGGNITARGLSIPPQPQNYTISYRGATGNDVVLTAQAVATVLSTTTLTSSMNPSVQGQAVTLTATITPATTTGTVTFFWHSAAGVLNNLGTVSPNASGVATHTMASLPVGSNTIFVRYSGGGVIAGSGAGIQQEVTAQIPALNARGVALLAIALAVTGALLIKS